MNSLMLVVTDETIKLILIFAVSASVLRWWDSSPTVRCYKQPRFTAVTEALLGALFSLGLTDDKVDN